MKKIYNPTDSLIDTLSLESTKVVIQPKGNVYLQDNVAEEIYKRYRFLEVSDISPDDVPKVKVIEPKKKSKKLTKANYAKKSRKKK